MIERGGPDPYLTSIGQTSGTARRAILNHRQLAQAADEVAPVNIDHVVLEDMSFAQKVELLASAALVIGQHGAGLVNTLWMTKGAIFELGQRRYSHFVRIAALKNLTYYWMPIGARICEVDPAEFQRRLKGALESFTH